MTLNEIRKEYRLTKDRVKAVNSTCNYLLSFNDYKQFFPIDEYLKQHTDYYNSKRTFYEYNIYDKFNAVSIHYLSYVLSIVLDVNQSKANKILWAKIYTNKLTCEHGKVEHPTSILVRSAINYCIVKDK